MLDKEIVESMARYLSYYITSNEIAVVVSRVTNGYTLTYIDQDTEEPRTKLLVFQEKEDDLNSSGEPDFHVVEDFIWELLGILGIYNSKHFKHRIEINVINQYEDSVS